MHFVIVSSSKAHCLYEPTEERVTAEYVTNNIQQSFALYVASTDFIFALVISSLKMLIKTTNSTWTT